MNTSYQLGDFRRPDGTNTTFDGSVGSGMEHVVLVQIEALPEGVYLATSDELPGLVAQGNTVAETLAIAQDIARILVEVRREHEDSVPLPAASARRDFTIVVTA